MNVKISEKRGKWDASPYTIEGVGTGFVLRPRPDAGGGAHPRYMRRGGFISLSPRLGLGLDPDEFFGGLPQTFVCELRRTKRGETFLAVLSSTSEKPTHIGFFSTAYSVRSKEGIFFTIADSEDRTASSATEAYLSFHVAQVGALIEEGDGDDDPVVYRVTEEGLTILSADERISAEDLEILG